MTEQKKKHPGGRPSKYTPELLEKAHEYLDVYQLNGEVIPSIVGLALHCDISNQRVYEWIKDADKQEFRDIVTRVSQKQELKLACGGLSNEFNANITKLLLSKHGYSDKAQIDHTTAGEKITQPQIIFDTPKKEPNE